MSNHLRGSTGGAQARGYLRCYPLVVSDSYLILTGKFRKNYRDDFG